MTDSARLARREAAPALMRLHRALSRLSGVLAVMNTGAHPDDEQSGMLAWFRFGLGHRVVIACSTRGEGGQNALGPERGALLGLIRTREMEEAARVLDCDVAWLGFGPDDPVHDFGFSKDGDATFARWGEARVVERMALAYRRYRPDVVIPTFLDVPGQHGHHRAMTRAAEAAIALAADPLALSGSNAPAWAVSHYYLPAWSGGGGTYDDALPPPPATLRIKAGPVDAATGVAFDELGEWSRRRHATQGMGWWQDDPQRAWDLHLVAGRAEARLAEGVPATLGDLAALAGGAAGPALAEAAGQVAAARAAFPDRAAILAALARADVALEAAQSAADPDFATAHGHRLSRKRREIGVALAEAAGLSPVLSVDPPRLTPGREARLSLHLPVPPQVRDATATPRPGGASVPLDNPRTDLAVSLPPALPPQFGEAFDPLGGNGPLWVEVTATVAGRPVTVSVDPETVPVLLPESTFAARPDTFVRRIGDDKPLVAGLGGDGPVKTDAPPGWRVAQDGRDLVIRPPADAPQGLVEIAPRIGSEPALTATTAAYPHVGAVTLLRPAALRVLTLDAALPEGARIACIGSGDSVGLWLERLGLDVTLLDEIAPDEDFARFTTVLVGVVAFGNRPDLAAATGRLHAFVRGGGHLVTLYQRPDQGWDAARTPPLFLRIGTPSLRWRVTDPAAPVAILQPDHPLLAGPNRIGPADFAGWDKERGLYFAADRDPAYAALLSMADAGEPPLDGALVSAPVGAGRHTHVSLVLHHQLDRLVPGAFRLMANLVQPAAPAAPG